MAGQSSSGVDLRRVDLNLLVAFDALLAERSVTAAAARLSIGQSAMSATLNRLRVVFDDPILVRDGRSMVATPVAESLAGPVREVLRSVEGVLARRQHFDPHSDRRTFRIIASDSSAIVILQPLLSRFAQEFPTLALRIRPPLPDSLEQVARGRQDLAIFPQALTPQTEGLSRELLYVDRYVLAVDRDNPEVGESVRDEQLQELMFLQAQVDFSPDSPIQSLDVMGVARRVEATTGVAVAPFLIRGTRLVTYIPLLVGMRIAAGAGLRLVEPPDPLSVAQMMVWSQRFDEDPAHVWLRQQLHKLTANLIH